MKTIEKRDYIHSNLHRLHETDIEEMFAIIRSLLNESASLSVVQEEELAYRTKKHKSGQSKSYSWEQVKENLDL